METKKAKTTVVVSLLALVGLLLLSLRGQAGNLEPSAPPGPTMKTLDEVEPRIPISQDDIPLTINQSGSYYLTEDVNSVGTAITVEVNDVTIDLMGYTIFGPDSGTNYGVCMYGRSNVEIRNGTVRNFGSCGILETGENGKEHRIIAVRVVSNGFTGISLNGASYLVKDCTAAENAGGGISSDRGSTVTGNTCYNNAGNGAQSGERDVFGKFTGYSSEHFPL